MKAIKCLSQFVPVTNRKSTLLHKCKVLPSRSTLKAIVRAALANSRQLPYLRKFTLLEQANQERGALILFYDLQLTAGFFFSHGLSALLDFVEKTEGCSAFHF